MTEATELPLDAVIVDPGLQPRVGGLDDAHVKDLQENPDGWPPLTIVERDGHRIVDGFHRFAAAQNLGRTTVCVRTRKVSATEDLRALAFSLNAAHGRPLSLADRRAEAERLLQADTTTSNAQIAKRTGLSPTTITAIRERLVVAKEIDEPDKRVNASGHAYEPAKPRQPGELPEDDWHPLDVVKSQGKKQAVRVVRYLKRLDQALDDQYRFDVWEDAEDAAEACRATLKEQEVVDLSETLGASARRVLDVAIALGYEDSAA